MKKAIDTNLSFSFRKNPDKDFLRRELGRISLSGVQEKFSAVADDGCLRLARDGEQGTYILKPAPEDPTLAYCKYLPVNEFITMKIAGDIYGIRTADTLLCKDSAGLPVLAVKRFDVQQDGSKLPQEEFASVLSRSGSNDGGNFKYSGTYADIATGIRKYIAAWPPVLEEFFRIVIFNYIFANADAHLKNFSIIRYGAEYRLSPAYDLLNTELHISGSDFALDGGLSPNLVRSDCYSSTGHPCHTDFAQFGHIIGLQERRISRIIKQFTELPPAVAAAVEASPLPVKLQRIYLRIIKERLARFRR